MPFQFKPDPAQLAQAEQEYREQTQARIDEPVEAAWLFQRPGGLAPYGVSKASPLASTIMRTLNKKRAAGFPTTFMLALTPTKLYAFESKYRSRSRRHELKDELAVWDRNGLKVGDIKETTLHTQLTIESPAEGEKVVCATGKDDVSRSFIQRLQSPVAAT